MIPSLMKMATTNLVHATPSNAHVTLRVRILCSCICLPRDVGYSPIALSGQGYDRTPSSHSILCSSKSLPCHLLRPHQMSSALPVSIAHNSEFSLTDGPHPAPPTTKGHQGATDDLSEGERKRWSSSVASFDASEASQHRSDQHGCWCHFRCLPTYRRIARQI